MGPAMSGKIYIMGPQSPNPNLPEVLEKNLPEGSLCVISTGWRHDEEDIDALESDLDRELTCIPLYRWFDSLGAKEPALSKQHAERQRLIRKFKKMYRMHLHTLLDLWQETQDWQEDGFFDAEEEQACKAVQNMDKHALERLENLRGLFPDLAKPWTHPSAAPYYSKIKEAFEKSSGLLIAGGHVAILLGRR